MRFPTAGLRIFRAAKWGLSIVRAVRLPSCDFIDPETFGPNPVPAMKLRPLYVRERSLTSTGFKIRRGARNPESPSTTGTVGFFFFFELLFPSANPVRRPRGQEWEAHRTTPGSKCPYQHTSQRKNTPRYPAWAA